MTTFASIEAAAAKRKGGAKALEKLLAKPRSKKSLAGTPDAIFLSAMAKQIFRAGFVWKIVEYKWPAVEEAFAGFDPEVVSGLDHRAIEELVSDPRMIRHRGKIESIRDNAAWMLRVGAPVGGFGAFLANWPEEDIVGLWAELKKSAKRLGGMTGPFFLRFVGKDTFMLSPDVVKALKRAKVVKGNPTSKRDLQAVQEAFNAWRKESRRPLCQISRILAYSVG